MKKRNKQTNFVKAGVAIAIIVGLIIPALTAGSFGKDSDLEVDIGGPFILPIGEYKTFNATITGGVPPYRNMWYWGDGSGGTASTHAFPGNEETEYTVTLVIKDSEDNIAIGSTRVSVDLPTDNNVFIEKFVKHADSSVWKKRVNAEIGDDLNIKIVIQTVGSDLLNLSVGDESLVGFDCDGNYTSTHNVTEFMYYPPGENWGPTFGWSFSYIVPNSTIEITYDLEVIDSDSNLPAYLEGLTGNGVSVYAYLANPGRIGPGGFLANDDDFIFVKIREEFTGIIYYVDDDGGADYTKIQDAIDNATDGDMVIVLPGFYNEQVLVDKSIQLLAKGQDVIIEHDSGSWRTETLIISADEVTVRGFTIQNARRTGIWIASQRNVIVGNTIQDNELNGIYLDSSYNNGNSNNIIKNNKIMRNKRGITVNSRYNLIKGNTIEDNDIGVLIDESFVANDVYHNNFIQNRLNALDSNGVHGNHWTGFSLSEKRFSGNYWDDYEGVDNDGDGYGDTPYTSISGFPFAGIVLDIYPHIKPFPTLKPAEAVKEISLP